MSATGKAPAVVLCDPHFAHNVGAALRAAACFGIPQLWFTGTRVSLFASKSERLPREERMKGYRSVQLIHADLPLEGFPDGVTPVGVEITKGAELLPNFVHPENPVYIFGPEDGSIPQSVRRHCHRFTVIPTRHCTNLAAAVYIVLYDRLLKQIQSGAVPSLPMSEVLAEHRGYLETNEEVLGKHDPLELLVTR